MIVSLSDRPFLLQNKSLNTIFYIFFVLQSFTRKNRANDKLLVKNLGITMAIEYILIGKEDIMEYTLFHFDRTIS